MMWSGSTHQIRLIRAHSSREFPNYSWRKFSRLVGGSSLLVLHPFSVLACILSCKSVLYELLRGSKQRLLCIFGAANFQKRDFKHRQYILETLQDVKFFVMCVIRIGPAVLAARCTVVRLTVLSVWDRCLDTYREVIPDLFATLFDCARDGHTRRVLGLMEGIMRDVIANADEGSLDNETVEVVLSQLVATSNEAATKLAKNVIKSCAEKLQSNVHSFFCELLGEYGKSSESDLKDCVYTLVEELCNVDVRVLLKVLPLVASRLVSEDDDEREQGVTVVGNIFAAHGKRLIQQHSQLWRAFLERGNDKAASVRIALLEYIPALAKLEGLSIWGAPGAEEADELVKLIKLRVTDEDERVRALALAGGFSIIEQNRKWAAEVLTDDVLSRCCDTKLSVRKVAFDGLAAFYDSAASRYDDGDAAVESEAVYNDAALTVLRTWNVGRRDVENKRWRGWLTARTTYERIFRASLDPMQRMLRLLRLFSKMDETERRSFQQFVSNSVLTRKNLLFAIEKCSSPPTKTYIGATAAKIATGLIPHSTVSGGSLRGIDDALVKVLNNKERRAQYLDLASNHAAEIVAALKHTISNKSMPANQVRVESTLLYRIVAPSVLVDQEMLVAALNELVLEGSSRWSDANILRGEIMPLLELMAEAAPDAFCSEEVMRLLCDLLHVREHTKYAMSILLKLPSVPQADTKMKKVLVNLAQDDDIDIANQAVRTVIEFFGSDSRPLKAIFGSYCATLENLHEQLLDEEDCEACVTAMSGLSLIAKHAVDLIEDQNPDMVKTIIVNTILRQTKFGADEDEAEDCPEWEAPSTECRLKLLALDFLANRLLCFNDKIRESEGRSISLDEARGSGLGVEATLRLLSSVIELNANIGADGVVPPAPVCARMRLAATKGILQVIAVPTYRTIFEEDWARFLNVAFMMQDSCEEVRDQIATEICAVGLKLPEHYSLTLVLGAADPVTELKSAALLQFNKLIRDWRKTRAVHIEQRLPSLLHLLAHHPDFQTEEVGMFTPNHLSEVQKESLRDAEIYLVAFCDACLSNRGHQHFKTLTESAEFLRTRAKDNIYDDSTAVYVLAELTLKILHTYRKKAQGWKLDSSDSFDGRLHGRMYAPIGTGDILPPRLLPASFKPSHDVAQLASPVKGAASPQKRTASNAPTIATKKSPKKSRVSQAKSSTTKSAKTKVVTAPTRVNARRAAKSAVPSMLDVDSSDGEDEVDSQGSKDDDADMADAQSAWVPVVSKLTNQSASRLKELTNATIAPLRPAAKDTIGFAHSLSPESDGSAPPAIMDDASASVAQRPISAQRRRGKRRAARL